MADATQKILIVYDHWWSVKKNIISSHILLLLDARLMYLIDFTSSLHSLCRGSLIKRLISNFKCFFFFHRDHSSFPSTTSTRLWLNCLNAINPPTGNSKPGLMANNC
jgi:hypothetical protein